jgi:8-oxo-dGTP pyrophosphatase MutT (NUDIX family)
VPAAYGGVVTLHDGNGWVECRCGQRHWGLHGAAGLLLARAGAPGSLEVLLQLRAAWTHQGGSWALLGGARDSHEDVVTAALREAREEAGVDAALLSLIGHQPGIEHPDWSYHYVLAIAPGDCPVEILTTESEELRWVATTEVAVLPLHPAFAEAWPQLCRALDAHAASAGDPAG